MAELALRPFQPLDLTAFPTFVAALGDAPRNFGHAVTACAGGAVVAIGGVVPLRSGVGEAWLVLAQPVNGHGTRLALACRTVLRRCAAELGLWRIQATALAANGPARQLLLALGFEPEGTLAQYGPNREDHVMFALVRRA